MSRQAPFQVIPAIDIRGGRAVRLYQGDYSRETVYAEDPTRVAAGWMEAGAPLIHMVDLDAAREGRQIHLDLIRRICASGARVQLGGGARSREAVLRALDAGVERVVLGTLAASRPALAAELFGELGDRLVLGLDARDGEVAVAGWLEGSGRKAADLAAEMVSAGARRIIFTDIRLDGTGAGPAIESTADLARQAGVPVIASGGVGSLQHLLDLREQAAAGIEGAIVGRALYDGSLDVRAALAVSRAAEPL